MTARRFTGLALGLIAGIVCAALAVHLPIALTVALLAAGAVLTALGIRAERHWRPWHPAIVFAAAAAIAFPPGYWRTAAETGEPSEGTLMHRLQEVEDGTRLRLRGTVSREPEARTGGQLDLQVRVRELQIGTDTNAGWTPVSGGDALVRVFTYAGNAPDTHEHFNRLAQPQTYGYLLEIVVPYRKVRPPLNPAEFDLGRFLRQSGADASLRCHAGRVAILEESRGNPLLELALAAKADFLETFKRTIRAPASRLAAAATLGARRAVEKTAFGGMDIAQTFRHAGVGHVLAVSGLHVSVIALMLFALFRLTGAPPKLFVPPLILFLILFALLTGARPSSVRAVIMNSVILLAIAYFRCDIRSATTIGLSLSAFAILLLTPLVLFAPSFLLSYGAVLSLIAIVPAMDRFLRSLRGFSLIGFLLWFSLMMALAITGVHRLCDPLNLTALGGLLWLLIAAGTPLNHRIPRMWTVGLERIPPVVRVFLAAQLAIQIGMMIPLSAWFFGQFPIAGVFVNLLAIPAIAILVQLGMMTGLAGLIPLVGQWLAMPMGAAATLVGNAFILLAYVGAIAFPFPAVPMPTPRWMLAYYGILAVVLLLEQRRTAVLDVIYRILPAPGSRGGRRRAVLSLALPVLLTALPLLHVLPNVRSARHVDILAAGRYPLTVITGGQHVLAINAGGRFDGERLLFESVRARGATRVQSLWLPSPDPRAGIEGGTALLARMPVQEILLPMLPSPDQRLTEAIGDRYLIEQAAEGTAWASRFDKAFDALRQEAGGRGTSLGTIGNTWNSPWGNVTVSMLPGLEHPPPRFAASAIAPLLHASINGLSWILVTDTTPEALTSALAGAVPCDILVVPNLSSYATYTGWMRTAVEKLHPRLLIIGGDTPVDDTRLRSIIRNANDLTILQTGRDGAVSATLHPDGTTRLATHRTRIRLRLAPGPD